MTTTPTKIDLRLGAVALRALAASREDSRPQAILKFHRPSSLDYRARHGLQVERALLSMNEMFISHFGIIRSYYAIFQKVKTS